VAAIKVARSVEALKCAPAASVARLLSCLGGRVIALPITIVHNRTASRLDRGCSPARNGAMLLTFFTELRAAKIPVTLREYLTLMEALERDLAEKRVEDFYYLARACLVKDERNLDKFDRVFGHAFKGLETLGQAVDTAEIPEDWLKKLAEKYLSDAE
jgi:uncharacterized protein with von Willebrand factor type A (vWA) domain